MSDHFLIDLTLMRKKSIRTAILVVSISVLFCSLGTFAAPQLEEGVADGTAMPGFFFNPFDSISSSEVLSSHMFTLDNFLESDPFYVVNRMGPIGAETGVSRYGIGEGRCSIYMEGVRLNDPQNDIAPFALIPTTSINGFVRGFEQSRSPFAEGIEGDFEIIPPPIPAKRPSVFMELSKGSNDLKQRRIRFSSVGSRLGVDLAYDELLNGGYQYDARNLSKGSGFGSSSNRIFSFRLRGGLADDDTYSFSFKQFKGTFQGDINSPHQPRLRRGHIAILRADLESLRVLTFSRGYEFSSPDSISSNETTGFKASYGYSLGKRAKAIAWGEAENIIAREMVGGIQSRPRLNVLSAGNQVTYNSGNFQTHGAVFLTYQFSHAYDAGGELSLRQRIPGGHVASISLRRNFRLPNLEELFLPKHLSSYDSSLVLVGNSQLHGEHSWEVTGAILGRIGPVLNEVRLTTMRISEAVSKVKSYREGKWRMVPMNGGISQLEVLQDRFRLSREFMSLKFMLDGGIMLARNDGGPLVGSVPKNRFSARLSMGRHVFKPSSSALLTIEYEHSSSRVSDGGMAIPGFDVLNLKLDVTLLDAHLYLAFLNVLNKKYQTVGPFLMTPRSFVYGVQWTLFE